MSYSHADTAWAKRIHAGLERFRIDSDLVGRPTEHGPIPSSIGPIFRDRHDFSAGGTLKEQTVEALDNAAALIVLCSTVAASRPAVNEEIRLFRSRHPDRPVIPVILEGKFPDNFPAALRYEVETDGTVTDRPVVLLAPDVREEGDGKDLALAKIVARLVGLEPDEVYRRAARQRQRSANIRNGIIATLAVLFVAATGSALYARDLLKKNEKFLNATLQKTTELINKAVAQAEAYKVPRTATLEFLKTAEGLFSTMSELGRQTPELRSTKAMMLIQFARNYSILGALFRSNVALSSKPRRQPDRIAA